MLRNRLYTWDIVKAPSIAIAAIGSTVLINALVTAGCKQPAPAIGSSPQYQLIQPAFTNSDGTVTVPLYEKRGDTNRLYTPALNGLDWVPLMR